MKRSRTLRVWALIAIIATILAAVLEIVLTVLSTVKVGNISRASTWAPGWLDYLYSLQCLISTNLWFIDSPSILYSSIFVAFLVLTVAFFVILLIVAGKRHCKSIRGAAFIELIIGLVLCYGYVVWFTGNLGYANGDTSKLVWVGTINKAIKEAIVFKADILSSILFYVLVVLGAVVLVTWIGTFIVALLKKCEKVVVEPTPVAEEKQEEPVAVAEPRQKKTGILLVRAYDKHYPTSRLIEKRDADYPHEPLQQKPLSADEIRAIMREELERQENEKIIAEYKAQKQAERIAAEVVKQQKAEQKEDLPKSQIVEPQPAPQPQPAPAAEEEVIPTPIVFASPVVVKEEKKPAKKVEKKEEKPQGLSEEQVKSIIADEIKAALKDFVVTVQKEVKVVEVREVPAEEPVVEEPQPEPVVEPAPVKEVVVEEEPAPAPVEEPVVEEPQPAPVASGEVVVTEVVEPAVEPAPVAVARIPFTTRILEADDEIKTAFNHLKSLLKSYGLNDRVSNGGDMFRLHKVTYAKITMAGKALKLYIALDPKDYADTKLPIKDASSKAMYAEIPLVFKVKSGLSLRRAEELLRDCMDKHGLEQVDRIQEYDWVADLANTVVEDDGSAEEEE